MSQPRNLITSKQLKLLCFPDICSDNIWTIQAMPLRHLFEHDLSQGTVKPSSSREREREREREKERERERERMSDIEKQIRPSSFIARAQHRTLLDRTNLRRIIILRRTHF